MQPAGSVEEIVESLLEQESTIIVQDYNIEQLLSEKEPSLVGLSEVLSNIIKGVEKLVRLNGKEQTREIRRKISKGKRKQYKKLVTLVNSLEETRNFMKEFRRLRREHITEGGLPGEAYFELSAEAMFSLECMRR